MKKSPLTITKERFGDKAGLVKAVRELATDELWLDRVNAGKGFKLPPPPPLPPSRRWRRRAAPAGVGR